MMIPPKFNRLHLVTGTEGFEALQSTHILVVGVGGVGSWCAESLVRSGIGKITIVDSDRVCVTNINRQLQATNISVGKLKVEVLKERLLEINPECEVTALAKVYDRESASSFILDDYDYVIDAIDSISAKVELIAETLKSRATLFSAMGAACKIDPSRIKAGKMKNTHGCPLAKIVRSKLRSRGIKKLDFWTIYSDELLDNHQSSVPCGTGNCVCPKVDENDHEWCSSKKKINGSLVHITGIYGFYLTGLVMQHILEKKGDLQKIR